MFMQLIKRETIFSLRPKYTYHIRFCINGQYYPVKLQRGLIFVKITTNSKEDQLKKCN